MRERHRFRSETFRSHTAPGGSHAGIFVAGTVAAALASSVVLVPAPFVLPVVASAALVAAALVAAHAWRRAGIDDPDRIGPWDLAGALALIGISAAELGDAEYLLTALR